MKLVLAALIPLLAVLTPGIPVVQGMPVFRLEDAVLALILSHGLLRSSTHRSTGGARPEPVTKAFLAMGALAIVSIFGSSALLHTPMVVNDWMILPMLLKYWLVFRFARSLAEPKARRVFFGATLAATSASAAVGVMQYNDLLSVNAWLTPLYLPAMRAEGIVEQLTAGSLWARAPGTAGDPRHFGFVLVVGIALAFARLLHTRTPQTIAWVLAAASTCLVSLIFTLSRTALLSLTVTGAAALWFSTRGGRHAFRTLGLGSAMVLLGLFLFQRFGTEGFETRVLDTETESFEMSWYARKRDLTQPFKDAFENPIIFLIGLGPSKATLRASSHNDFGWYFHRFGAGGLSFYLLLLWHGLARPLRLHSSVPTPFERSLVLAAFMVSVNWAVFAAAEAIFKNPQIMVVNMLFLGLLFPFRPVTARPPATGRHTRRTALAHPQHLLRRTIT